MTFRNAQEAQESRSAIEEVSVEDTNTAITAALVAMGFAGTIEVTGKEAKIKAGPMQRQCRTLRWQSSWASQSHIFCRSELALGILICTHFIIDSMHLSFTMTFYGLAWWNVFLMETLFLMEACS